MVEIGKEVKAKPFEELYAGAKASADGILAGINEHFDYPFTLLMVATYEYITYALWGQGHYIWAFVFSLTALSQLFRISMKFGLRWWVKRKTRLLMQNICIN